MDNVSLALLGTGISFQDPEQAQKFGYEGCDMQAELLPARLRRRTSIATKMAFAAAERACRDADLEPSELPVIFTSSLGEIAVTDKLCNDIAHQNFPVSPTQFHNSVHNTASGYWSIAVGSRHQAMAMGGYQDSFALGLLEAWSQLHTVEDKLLLVCYEESLPQLMLPGNQWIGSATAFVLASGEGPDGSAAAIGMPFCNHDAKIESDYAARSPALAALPLFDAVAEKRVGKVQISPAGDSSWFTELFLKDG